MIVNQFIEMVNYTMIENISGHLNQVLDRESRQGYNEIWVSQLEGASRSGGVIPPLRGSKFPQHPTSPSP